MEKQKTIHLQLIAKKRSDAALSAIQDARDGLTRDFHAGRLTPQDLAALTLGSFCVRAGLGPNFLNGEKYKEHVKPEIKEFIKKLKATAANERAAPPRGPTYTERLELSNARLRDQVHAARLLLHEKRSVIRTISRKAEAKVVRLLPQEPT
ncbi:hypothetical protein ACCS68_04250 [Rhizobium beringeri]|uniref:hypothetical protein n=1 Tax=Rhizobium beringeri TaxID=3019934 RepID=UPI003CE7DC31